MTDDDSEDTLYKWDDLHHGDCASVSDSDPRHIDPAGDLADAAEGGELGSVNPRLEVQDSDRPRVPRK